MSEDTSPPLTLMVSSTVHGQEALLQQVFATLSGFGYRVWMSHMGTIPNVGFAPPFDACRVAAKNCDLFLGIITGRYGNPKTFSITHEECRIALGAGKPICFLVEEKITIAHQLLKKLRTAPETQKHLPKLLAGNPILDNLRILELYDEARAIREGESQNWVQVYRTDRDVLRFLTEQYANYDGVRSRLIGGIT